MYALLGSGVFSRVFSVELKSMFINWLILLTFWFGNAERQPTTPKLVSNGLVRGFVSSSGLVEEYLGIPYATVTQRFQAPGPEPKWDGVYEANKDLILCFQILQLELVMGQKDCLVLNVFVPIISSSTTVPLPVMVFIHGGGFQIGTSTPKMYGPEYLVPHGVILVTINYRLGIEGFLCLGTKDAPGNIGLKDQVAALKWIKKNISRFGGDPDNITLFGESAGSASVSYHVLSPMSKSLFQKAIQQSGSSLALWTMQRDPLKPAFELAKSFEHEEEDVIALNKILVNKTEKELLLAMIPKKDLSTVTFVPCVEKEIKGVPAFLTRTPRQVFEEGEINKVPMIIGSNSNEGPFFANMGDDIFEFDFNRSLPEDLLLSPSEKQDVLEQISELYMNNEAVTIDTIANFSRFLGEMFINYPVQAETELIVSASDQSVYNYLFNFVGQNNLMKSMLRKELKETEGATHADELTYLFSQDSVEPIEITMIRRLTTLWTNFAKFGDPTPEPSELLPERWPTVNLTAPTQTFVIDTEFTMVPLWFEQRLKFWDEMYKKYKIFEIDER